MKLRQLPNGNLLIPVAEEYGSLQIDGQEEIAPDDPRYADWARFLGTPWEEPLSEETWARLLAEHEAATTSSS
jgi:hypothetical protein